MEVFKETLKPSRANSDREDGRGRGSGDDVRGATAAQAPLSLGGVE